MKKRKALLALLCVVAIVAASVFGTLAYLTDTDTNTNTFTVGDVQIKLDEAKVDENGNPIANADRVKANDYHLLPGHTYTKDPTVTVLDGSEETYVRMLVTVNFSKELDAIFASHDGADLKQIFDGNDPANWTLIDDVKDAEKNTRTYEFRYVGEDNKGSKDGTVKKADGADIVLDALFDEIKVPGWITKEQLATLVGEGENNKFTITVEGQAIQADGFDTADAAWAAFK